MDKHRPAAPKYEWNTQQLIIEANNIRIWSKALLFIDVEMNWFTSVKESTLENDQEVRFYLCDMIIKFSRVDKYISIIYNDLKLSDA